MRVEFNRDDVLWKQGSWSDCTYLLVQGTLKSVVEGTDAIETIPCGNIVGEVPFVHRTNRLTTLSCHSETVLCYRIDRDQWETLQNKAPKAARMLDEVAIRYLTQRVQHVSNRIFETRCLFV